jgi:hypothetical protein
MEGDLTISRYDPDPVPVMASIDGEIRQTKLDAIVYFVDGHTEWWEFKRSEDAGPDRTGRARPQLSAQAQAANHVGVPYRVKTEIDLRGNEIQFDNWLLLCAAMTRSRNQPMHHEARILESRLNMHEAVAIGALLEEPEADPGLMLAIIAKSLQRGFIHTELIKDLITRNSIVSRSSK